MIHPRQPTRVPRCELAHAAGLAELCPGPSCAFWDRETGCALGGLRADLASNGALAHLLLALRERVGDEQSHPVALPGLDL